MGDKVTIKVVGANRYERQIDFELVKKARKRKKGKRWRNNKEVIMQ